MYQELLDTASFLRQEPVRQVQTGRTPHTVIHRENKACVRWFAPAAPKHRPVFVSMPLINTWTIFDLLPGRSVVERLVAAGVPVYVLDWGRPGPEDSERPLTDYVDTLLGRAIARARRHAGEDLDVIGYCVGGTFLAIHLARNPAPVRRACFLATPIDFHQSGRLCTWATPGAFPLDDIVDGFGNFPRELMRQSFAWLRPSGQLSKWRSLHDNIRSESYRELWAAMEQWNNDGVDFPGEAYRAYVRGCYFDNLLVRGGWMLHGRPVSLANAKMPALVLAAGDDHIVPEAAAFALREAWGGPVATQTLRGGHVGVCVGRALPERLLEWIRGA